MDIRFYSFLPKMKVFGFIFLHVLMVVILCGVAQSVQFQKYDGKVMMKRYATRKPVVLVPGVLGSRMQAKLNLNKSPGFLCEMVRDWFDIWLNIEELIPLYVDCWVYDISLRFNSTTKDIRNQDGVDTKIPNYGTTEDFEFLDTDHYAPGSPYFDKLVDYIVGLGFERGKDLKGAPFDWRYTPISSQKYLDNLTKLIENNYYQHYNRKVVVIGHSMGNMFIYYMLKHKPQEWKDKFIDSFISINSPYIGSVKALKAITSGETEGHDFVLPKLKLRTATRTFSSSFMLLPRPDFWPSDKKQVVDTLVRNYTVHDYKALFKRIGCKNCWELWEAYGSELGDLSAPNVPVHCVYSAEVPTAEVLIYDPDLFPDGTPVLKTGDGDGTVNTFSSSYCLKWTKQQNQPVYDAFMPGNGHVEILNNATLHEYIRKVVMGSGTLKQVKKLDIL